MKKTPTTPAARPAASAPTSAAARDSANGSPGAALHPSTLAIDIGGTGLKASVLDSAGQMISERVTVPTPYPCPPDTMVRTLVKLVKPVPAFDRVAVGFPGQVRHHRIVTAPHFGTEIWSGFNLGQALAAKLGKPVRVLNDADMQGLGAIHGHGLELVVTLGTGVGTALFRNGDLMPHLELAHHPIRRDKTYNEYLGNVTMNKVGGEKWNRRVRRMITILENLINPDTIYIGGGNATKIVGELPPHVHITSNVQGILGGFRLWEPRQVEPHSNGQ
jgi:polyphosphate glucokinase